MPASTPMRRCATFSGRIMRVCDLATNALVLVEGLIAQRSMAGLNGIDRQTPVALLRRQRNFIHANAVSGCSHLCVGRSLLGMLGRGGQEQGYSFGSAVGAAAV